jgi:hypothetical protein
MKIRDPLPHVFDTLFSTDKTKKELPYFPAHKMHRDFFVRNFRKKEKIMRNIF